MKYIYVLYTTLIFFNFADGAKGITRRQRQRSSHTFAQMMGSTDNQQTAVKIFSEVVKRGCHACIQKLILLGADQNAHDEMGMAPLHVAAEHGNCAAIATLLNAGARKDLRNTQGHTALQVAARKGHRTIVKMLLPATAHYDTQSDEDALYIAAARGDASAVKALFARQGCCSNC